MLLPTTSTHSAMPSANHWGQRQHYNILNHQCRIKLNLKTLLWDKKKTSFVILYSRGFKWQPGPSVCWYIHTCMWWLSDGYDDTNLFTKQTFPAEAAGHIILFSYPADWPGSNIQEIGKAFEQSFVCSSRLKFHGKCFFFFPVRQK